MNNENRTNKCPDCGGHGEHVGSHRYRCTACDGKGELSDRDYLLYMSRQKEKDIRAELMSKVRHKLYRLSNEQLESILLLEDSQ